jgi:hypothetical protein
MFTNVEVRLFAMVARTKKRYHILPAAGRGDIRLPRWPAPNETRKSSRQRLSGLLHAIGNDQPLESPASFVFRAARDATGIDLSTRHSGEFSGESLNAFLRQHPPDLLTSLDLANHLTDGFIIRHPALIVHRVVRDTAMAIDVAFLRRYPQRAKDAGVVAGRQMWSLMDAVTGPDRFRAMLQI